MSTEPDTLAAVETDTAPLQLLHLDERLAVVNKPAGLMVHDSKLARG
ncbi:MAG: pseudouridylate synthase, partial [Stenotrophomonas sp.]|nr:pseudouridylate synthase [Stenotrophomonas sp.]